MEVTGLSVQRAHNQQVLPIAYLDQLSQAEFADAVRPLFESAPPLTEALYAARPFTSYEALIDTAETLTQSMDITKQVDVLSAHPRIGANRATLSALSAREQGADEPQWIYDELTRRNDEYERRFGFRFVVFVNRRPKSEILKVLEERLNNSRDVELTTGIRDMFLIARDRLCSLTP